MTTPAGQPLREVDSLIPAGRRGIGSALLPWPDLAARCLTPERMDDPRLEAAAHHQALDGLRRVNLFSRTVASFWRPISALARRTGGRALRVLDIGAGGGDLAIGLQRRADRAGLALQVDGCDVSGRAVEYARRNASVRNVSAGFFVHDALADPMPRGYDVIVSNLLLHHLTGPGIVEFLQNGAGAAGALLLMSDLVRTRAGYCLAWCGTGLLSRSPIMHADGPQSVRAALTVREMKRLSIDAGLGSAEIHRGFPCRMMLTWRRS